VSVHRRERLAREIARSVAAIIQHEISDPRMGFVSVTGARISKDLKHARVLVSVMGDEKKKRLTLQGLRHAAGFIRSGLAGRLAVRECPTLEFRLDDTIDKTFAITRLIDEVAAARPAAEEE
jgi:ribosome-binding factor A